MFRLKLGLIANDITGRTRNRYIGVSWCAFLSDAALYEIPNSNMSPKVVTPERV